MVDYNIKRTFYLVLLLWTGALIVSFIWNYIHLHHDTIEIATKEARANINKDEAIRFWAAKHGGVYVPPNERTPPNPYLSHIKDRDIVSTTGKQLTLMNPAYIVRQMTQEYGLLFGIKGKITALKVLNPINTPDEWEVKALKILNSGVNEVAEVVNQDGKEYVRMMSPLITEESCLKCHAHQGYKLGDIRGGIAVSVPLEKYLPMHRHHINVLTLSHSVFWFLGIIVIMFLTRRIRQGINQVVQTDEALRKVNNELKKKTKEVEAANEELAQYAYVVSHDLKAPLRAIHNYAVFLQEDLEDSLEGEQKIYLHNITRAVMQGERLVNDILELSRIGRIGGDPVPFNIGDELKQICSEAPDNVEVSIQENLPTVELDPLLFRQIFQNLITNAIKFNRSNPIRVEIGYARHGEDKYEIFVKDNGIGIKDEYINQIFQVFKRLHTSTEYEGTGIGLSIVKKCVAVLNGSLRVESTPNQGSVFYVIIPEKMKSEEQT
jgi:hypothetical protein